MGYLGQGGTIEPEEKGMAEPSRDKTDELVTQAHKNLERLLEEKNEQVYELRNKLARMKDRLGRAEEALEHIGQYNEMLDEVEG